MKTGQIFSLLLQYFVLDKKINNLFFYNCYSVQENLGFMLNASKEGTPLKIISLNGMTDAKEIVKQLLLWSNEMSSLGIILDYNCHGSDKLIKTSAEKLCFSKKFKWLIYEENFRLNNSLLLKQLKKTKLFVDADISYITFDSSNASKVNESGTVVQRYPMYDVYNNGFTHGGKLNITFDRQFIYNNKTGTGSFTESILQRKRRYDNRNDLSDIILRIGFVAQGRPITLPPKVLWDYVTTDPDVITDTLTKFASHIFTNMFEMLQCSISPRPFTRWTINDSYGAAIQAMDEDEIDLISFSLIFSIARLNYISLVSQFAPFQSVMYFRTPRTVDPLSTAFFEPFGTSIWICLAAVTIVISIAMRFMLIWEHKLLQTKAKGSTLLFFGETLGAFCQQGISTVPKLTSGRCACVFLFLSSIIIYNYYTSALVSILVSSPSKTNIKTLEDIADSKLIVGFEDVAHMRVYAKNIDQDDIRYLADRKVNVSDENIFLAPADGLRLMQAGGYAFQCDAATANPIIQKTFETYQLCDLNIIPFRRNKYVGLATRKRDPFKEIYATRYAWMREVGIVSSHKRRWLTKKPPCLANGIVASVGFESTASLFILLAIAYAFTLIILLCEVIWSIYQKKTKQKRMNGPRLNRVETTILKEIDYVN